MSSKEFETATEFNKKYRNKKSIPEQNYIERLIKISRVTKVTKGGKKLSFRAIVVIGDEKGLVGVGVGKAEDVVNAFQKARVNAVKNIIKIPITKSLSIPHRVLADVGACKIIMRPSIEGSGVIAGGAVRTVLEVAGIKNVIAKQLGSDNLLNNARAAIVALKSLTTESEVLKKRGLLTSRTTSTSDE
jgi:small subunit ribosomal protein S5